jgi:MFS family permease
MTRTERTYYVVLASWSTWMWFISPMYSLFLASRGLDLFEVNLVLATFMIAVFALEVPTGAVADLFGRKISFVLACFIRMGAFGLYAFADGFLDCVIAELIDALGHTLASGALDAWVVDGMRAEGDHRPTDRMFARSQMLSRTLMIGGGLGAGYLSDVDITWPWLAAAAGFGATGVLALVLMQEVPFERPALRSLHRSLGRTIAEGVAEVRSTPVVRGLCLLTFAVGFAVLTVSMTWAPRMRTLSGEGFWLLGWLWAFFNLAGLAGSAVAARYGERIGRARLLCAAELMRAGGLVIGAIPGRFTPAVTGLLADQAGMGAAIPTVDGWLNDHIEPERRATVLSVNNMFFTLGGGVGLVSLGLIAEHAGIPAAWLASAAILAVVAPSYLLLGRIARRHADAAGLIAATESLEPTRSSRGASSA